jgi:hypothetical protein
VNESMIELNLHAIKRRRNDCDPCRNPAKGSSPTTVILGWVARAVGSWREDEVSSGVVCHGRQD